MRRATLAIHGIWGRARDLNWIEVFEEEARYELDVRAREYGYVAAILSCFAWYRNKIIDSEVAYYNRLLRQDAPPNLIAHSFGGYVAWALMADRGLRFHNVALLAPAIPEDTNWKLFDSRFSSVGVYWSGRDEIIGSAPYGKMGKVGPQVEHNRVASIETGLLHADYVERKRMKSYIEFLRRE